MTAWRCWTVVAVLVVGLISGRPVHAGSKTVELKINGLIALADLVLPDGGSMKERVVLITHGTLAHKDMELVESLQNALAENGVASLAHTLTLGLNNRQGMYDCAKPHTHRHEDALNEIGAWLEWLKSQGAGNVTLLGHSRGGNQVARFAAERAGNLVKKLVLIAPATSSSPDSVANSYRQRFGTDLGEFLKQAQTLVSSGKQQDMMSLPGFLYCADAKAQAGSVVSYYGGDPRGDTPSLLPELKVPALVIAGSADTVVPDVAKRVRPLADGKNIILNVIDGADHMFLDFYVEDAAELVAEFVKN